jgi:hypothetical protein
LNVEPAPAAPQIAHTLRSRDLGALSVAQLCIQFPGVLALALYAAAVQRASVFVWAGTSTASTAP